MITGLIENYKELTVVGVFAIAMVWYLWHTTRRQANREDKREERDAKREEKVLNMVDSSLKTIEVTTTKNKALNKQIAVIQERTLKMIEKHDKESQDAFSKLCETLDNMLHSSNGGNPIVAKWIDEVKRLKVEIKKKLDKKS